MTASCVLCCRCGRIAGGCRISGSSGGISACAELEASVIALVNMRPSENEDNFPDCLLFGFFCSFAKQFKVGKMTASVRFERLL